MDQETTVTISIPIPEPEPTQTHPDIWLSDSCPVTNCEHYQKFLTSHGIKVQRNDKGQFVKGNTESVGNEGGRPCEYCENKEKYQKIADEYIERCESTGEGKAAIPFIEELALRMKKYREIILDWEKKMLPDGTPEHPEFVLTLKRIDSLQRLRLMQRTLGRYNPTGAIFQLKSNHGFMESEKKVIAGDKNEPLQVEIIEEKVR